MDEHRATNDYVAVFGSQAKALGFSLNGTGGSELQVLRDHADRFPDQLFVHAPHDVKQNGPCIMVYLQTKKKLSPSDMVLGIEQLKESLPKEHHGFPVIANFQGAMRF